MVGDLAWFAAVGYNCWLLYHSGYHGWSGIGAIIGVAFNALYHADAWRVRNLPYTTPEQSTFLERTGYRNKPERNVSETL